MCCFSGDEPVQVNNTRIFGRLTSFAEQALAYAMHIEARSEVAMVLPVPLRQGGRFKFIDLSAYPSLFEDLDALFPRPQASRGRGGDDLLSAKDGGLLEVERVGAFDASFVPARKDFARLDPAFRINDDAWKALPQYADWSFAVFKLRAGAQSVQPMAYQWQSRFSDRVFFPTVHIHDGAVHKEAEFDHALYAQLPYGHTPEPTWSTSPTLAATNIALDRAQRTLVNRRVFRRHLIGSLKNADHTLKAIAPAV